MVDEVLHLEALYRERYDGWNVRHFHGFYRLRHGGQRSYTWVKNRSQARRSSQADAGQGTPPQAP